MAHTSNKKKNGRFKPSNIKNQNEVYNEGYKSVCADIAWRN